jgi:hypothetical protein
LGFTSNIRSIGNAIADFAVFDAQFILILAHSHAKCAIFPLLKR